MYAYICPDCGAYLDPGEQCDCKEKAAPGGTNTEGGIRKELTDILQSVSGNVNTYLKGEDDDV